MTATRTQPTHRPAYQRLQAWRQEMARRHPQPPKRWPDLLTEEERQEGDQLLVAALEEEARAATRS